MKIMDSVTVWLRNSQERLVVGEEAPAERVEEKQEECLSSTKQQSDENMQDDDDDEQDYSDDSDEQDYDDSIRPSSRLLGKESEVSTRRIDTKDYRSAHIIYPDNFYIRYWDALMLALILLYAFLVPYQLCVSGGAHLLRSVPWFIITILMNFAFLVDTILPFFRAYRDNRNGRLIVDPKSIRWNYLRSLFIPNLLSNFPTTIIFYIWGQIVISNDAQTDDILNEDGGTLLNVLKLSDLLKLLRLSRAQRLLSTSDFIREFQEKRNAYTIRLGVFVFLIVMAAHWFACIWCGVAFVQVEGFDAESILARDNWIANWYKLNYEEGGLDPLGWKNDTNRYVLSLFWAIQTITSIGYGNIVPFTPVEWWMGCIMQLMAGVLWAYIIGGLVGVVTAMEVKNELFRERLDDANRLISLILPEERQYRSKKKSRIRYLTERKRLAKRIRRYIYTQNERPQSAFRYRSNLEERFPVLETLSPDLQRSATLMVMHRYLEMVPYLSSRYLSRHEQSLVAQRCVVLEFPSEDGFQLDDGIAEYGRGILVQVSGLLWRASKLIELMPVLSGSVLGEDSVLLDDGGQHYIKPILTLSFSIVVFIPRDAVLEALRRNPRAWRNCARWKYVGAALVQKAYQHLVAQGKIRADRRWYH